MNTDFNVFKYITKIFKVPTVYIVDVQQIRTPKTSVKNLDSEFSLAS